MARKPKKSVAKGKRSRKAKVRDLPASGEGARKTKGGLNFTAGMLLPAVQTSLSSFEQKVR